MDEFILPQKMGIGERLGNTARKAKRSKTYTTTKQNFQTLFKDFSNQQKKKRALLSRYQSEEKERRLKRRLKSRVTKKKTKRNRRYSIFGL